MDEKSKLIRPSAVAGQFYEADPVLLDAELSGFFANCADLPARYQHGYLRAFISPHAGYLYSGQIAAKLFALAKANFNYKRAVIIAPSHRVPFSGLATCSYDAYETPLGTLSVDREICEKLRTSQAVVELDAAHRDEHALEVQLPFLQKMLENSSVTEEFKIIPLICGAVDDEVAKFAAEALLPYWNRDTLWIISSDFTHYGRSFGYLPFTENVPDELKKLDLGAVNAIEKLDYTAFDDYIFNTGATICGANPIKLILKCIELSSQDDNITAQLIDYTNSGELTGDYSHCVSYAGIGFFND